MLFPVTNKKENMGFNTNQILELCQKKKKSGNLLMEQVNFIKNKTFWLGR